MGYWNYFKTHFKYAVIGIVSAILMLFALFCFILGATGTALVVFLIAIGLMFYAKYRMNEFYFNREDGNKVYVMKGRFR